MKASLNNFFSQYILSPMEPESRRTTLFKVINISFFLISLFVQFYFIRKTENDVSQINALKSIWVLLALASCLKILFTEGRKVFLFIFYLVYAKNRSLLFLLLVNILFFPIELLFYSFVDGYIETGVMKMNTSILAGLSYFYFYYLFTRLVFVFVFQSTASKENKGNVR